MKRLYVVRHAEASWSNKLLSDYERPLKKEGIKDAQKIGSYLYLKKYIPQCILYSSAKRTTETAEIIYNHFNNNFIGLVNHKLLYGGSVGDILDTLKAITNYESIMFVGHNPSITRLINQISDAKIDDVPTSGAAIIDFNGMNTSGKLVEFVYPKKLNLIKEI
tara:strand:+ start:199 stop:687 length:489 start_codon:yes stop_codon:yes gene_type:complete